MNTKKISTITVALVTLCIVAFAGLASANSTYTTSATGNGINGGQVIAPTSIQGTGPDTYFAHIFLNGAGQSGEIICQMSTTVNANSYISFYGAGNANVAVSVSNSANGPWQPIGSKTLGPLPAAWSNIQSAYSFSYVKLSVSTSGSIINAYIDCLLTM